MTSAKALTALASALGVAASLAPDGLSSSDWITIALAFLGAVGVYSVPNRPKEP
jgi:hypothetical protein